MKHKKIFGILSVQFLFQILILIFLILPHLGLFPTTAKKLYEEYSNVFEGIENVCNNYQNEFEGINTLRIRLNRRNDLQDGYIYIEDLEISIDEGLLSQSQRESLKDIQIHKLLEASYWGMSKYPYIDTIYIGENYAILHGGTGIFSEGILYMKDNSSNIEQTIGVKTIDDLEFIAPNWYYIQYR